VSTTTPLRDEFLSEEDLDLRNLSWEELLAWWNLWLEHAQATNDLDRHTYSHGVFTVEPGHERGERLPVAQRPGNGYWPPSAADG
jgi:hypothetical protein